MKTIKIILGIILITFCDIRAQRDTIIYYPDRGEYEISYWTNIADRDTFMTVIFIPSNKVIPKIECSIKKKRHEFIFAYKIANLSESKMPLESFTLLIDTLVNYRDFTTNDWRDGDTVKVYRGEQTWFGHYGNQTAYGSGEIKINQSKDGFIINSENLPGIEDAIFQGRTPFYTLGEEETSDFLDNALDSLSSFPRNYVLRKTVVPVYVSPTISDIDFLYTLKSYVNQSSSLGWIKQEQIKNKYQSYLTNAKTALQQSNNPLARYFLKNILHNVNIDSTGAITSEAYAFLRYNTEYLLGKIPQVDPTIANISPSITTTKTKEFTLSVNGNSFTPVSVVYFNGAPRKTTFVSGTLLKVDIDKKDTEKDGRYTVWVVNDEGKASDTLYFSIYKKLPKEVNPVLNCIEEIGKEKFRAWFGYENKNEGSVLLDQESENKFNPAPQERGQPTIFLPGKHDKVFSVEFEGNKKLMWKLDKEKAEASKDSQRCK